MKFNCLRCRSSCDLRLQAWIPSAEPVDGTGGVQSIPVECCDRCYTQLGSGVVWEEVMVTAMKEKGLDVQGLVVWECDHFLRLGRVYEDTGGLRWACVDYSDAHGLCFLCAHIRQPNGSRVDTRHDTLDTAWFDPDGVEINGPHHRLVRCVAHGPNYMPGTCVDTPPRFPMGLTAKKDPS